MKNSNLPFVFCCLFVPAFSFGQTPSVEPSEKEPPLPVIDYKACPFEGCTFGKWIVTRDVALFSSWKEPRTPVATVKEGQIVTGITGVHITYEPDRIQVLQTIPELHLQPGDIIFRYMYRGEGFADIWAKGQFKREYDCTFITEKNNSGCLRDCAAKVISEGRKDWWVRVKTSKGLIGWTIAEGQFDCMDSLGGDPKCENPGAPSAAAENKPTSIDEARLAIESNLRTPEGKAYDQQVGAEFTRIHPDTIRLCKTTSPEEKEEFWLLLKFNSKGAIKEVLLYPTNNLGKCVRETLLRDSFSPPPRPDYWVGVYLKTGQ
jgi:hypothetical protein